MAPAEAVYRAPAVVRVHAEGVATTWIPPGGQKFGMATEVPIVSLQECWRGIVLTRSRSAYVNKFDALLADRNALPTKELTKRGAVSLLLRGRPSVG